MELQRVRHEGLGALAALDDECLLHVIHRLPLETVVAVRCASKLLALITREEPLWKQVRTRSNLRAPAWRNRKHPHCLGFRNPILRLESFHKALLPMDSFVSFMWVFENLGKLNMKNT